MTVILYQMGEHAIRAIEALFHFTNCLLPILNSNNLGIFLKIKKKTYLEATVLIGAATLLMT
jgi:hypothetical protein